MKAIWLRVPQGQGGMMRRDVLLACAAILCLLAGMAAKSLLVGIPPVRAQASAAQFDAMQAKARLARILGDQRPHPADSVENDAVRARLLTELSSIGLHPIVRDQSVCNDFAKARLVACARVRNVIAVIGPRAGKALLLSAHYDSVPVGPGAGDDGVGVATLLEVGSILQKQPLKRPVILLFNEGEELGLVGARAFLADPLSRNVDSLLNFEARGVTGPVTMFETSQPNGPAVAAYSKAVRRPYASSLSADVARLIPNDTDVTTYKERGWLTLNFAMTGNETRYHSPGDDVAALDPRSLQDMGDQALAVAAGLAMAPASNATGQQLFVDIGRVGLWHMPQSLGAIALATLLLLFGFVAWQRQASFRGPAIPFGAFLVAVGAAWVAIALMGVLVSGTYWRAYPEVAFTAVYATVILGSLVVLLTLGARLGVQQLRAGFWLLFLLIGAALAFVAPGGIIYFLAPPAVALLGIGASRWSRHAETVGAVAALVLLYVIWGELLVALEDIFSPGPLWVVAPAAAIIIIPVLVEMGNAFAGTRRHALLLASALIAVVAWTVAAFTPAYSRDREQRFTIEHVTDFTSRHSYWSIANDGASLPQPYRSIGVWRRDKLPFSERQRWLTAAPAEPGVVAPTLQLIESLDHGSERTIRLRLVANGSQRIYIIAPSEARIRAAGIEGFVRTAGDSASEGKFTITCTGQSCDGTELRIDLGTAGPVVFTVIGARNGLPRAAAQLVFSRPQFARPQYTPDETVAFAKVRI